MTQTCEMCATTGQAVEARATVRNRYGPIPLCAGCARQGGIYVVRAILPDGTVGTSEEHVGPNGRELMTHDRAEEVARDLEATAADVGHEGARYEAHELTRAEIAERLA